VPDHLPGRAVAVPLRRLPRWLAGFAERHGPVLVARAGEPGAAPSWQLAAPDGARALVHAPAWVAALGPVPLGPPPPSPEQELAALAALQPCFGAVLIRRAGYAIGLFEGTELVERKVGARHIHGRTAAGGWSQQRYARRRANQADEIAEAAARAADRLLAGPLPQPQFLVTGGDRPLLAAALGAASPPVAALTVTAHLGIGTPDAAVLARVPDHVLVARIEVSDP